MGKGFKTLEGGGDLQTSEDRDRGLSALKTRRYAGTACVPLSLEDVWEMKI